MLNIINETGRSPVEYDNMKFYNERYIRWAEPTLIMRFIKCCNIKLWKMNNKSNWAKPNAIIMNLKKLNMEAPE